MAYENTLIFISIFGLLLFIILNFIFFYGPVQATSQQLTKVSQDVDRAAMRAESIENKIDSLLNKVPVVEDALCTALADNVDAPIIGGFVAPFYQRLIDGGICIPR